jgi:hypothetical protein
LPSRYVARRGGRGRMEPHRRSRRIAPTQQIRSSEEAPDDPRLPGRRI